MDGRLDARVEDRFAEIAPQLARQLAEKRLIAIDAGHAGILGARFPYADIPRKS